MRSNLILVLAPFFLLIGRNNREQSVVKSNFTLLPFQGSRSRPSRIEMKDVFGRMEGEVDRSGPIPPRLIKG